MLFDRPSGPEAPDVYAPDEIALAAGVEVSDVLRALENGQAVAFRGLIPEEDAVRLVARLQARTGGGPDDRAPIPWRADRRRPVLPGLTASGLMHAIGISLLLLIASSGLLSEERVAPATRPAPSAQLVFLMTPGPGGGGGGSGVNRPDPPPPARRAPDPPKLVARISSPVPPVRKVAPPPRPIERPKPLVALPRVDPVKVEPAPPDPPAVQAPVKPVPADPLTAAGVVTDRPDLAMGGSGTGGIPGTGRGTGLGEGQGPGIGPGSGGGTGGGPYRPGSGIEPPRLVREVRPVYTDDARRRAIEGDVVLEIVVTRAGSVDRVRVVRGLGAGLDQNAMAAVRQWRFDPARRQGAAVDVVVEVSVEFRMRDF